MSSSAMRLLNPKDGVMLHNAAGITNDAATLCRDLASKVKAIRSKDVKAPVKELKQIEQELSLMNSALLMVSSDTKIGAGAVGGAGALYAADRLHTDENRAFKITRKSVNLAERPALANITNLVNKKETTSESAQRDKRRVSGPSFQTPKKHKTIKLPPPEDGCAYSSK